MSVYVGYKILVQVLYPRGQAPQTRFLAQHLTYRAGRLARLSCAQRCWHTAQAARTYAERYYWHLRAGTVSDPVWYIGELEQAFFNLPPIVPLRACRPVPL